ncbi:P-loop containing nucleoside triphosphate hydrolase protein [Thelephora ganbajun]|uniref:P-loop containing nucleoside triphosphate hydrolase protein n=1 Tax=Thelephora ganbajun TaxID=370292 RepID=A0ACB6ZF97_THEGA|nr:P-loop containing nucleoside triphosphate hydrolase protein [Thelephora ganbajun]
MASSTNAASSGDLIDLVSTSASTTVYPTDDAILAVLNARFRSDNPYTRISTSNLVVVNPYKTLANINEVTAKDYEERCYRDTSMPLPGGPAPPSPHLYELAAKVYLVMRRRNQPQSVIFRGITGSGKTFSTDLLVNQLLRFSTHSKRESKITDQIRALGTLLDSFGNAKTITNPNASRHGRYLQLFFNNRGRIAAAKVLTYGLDKSRLNHLSHEERTYHVFYQLLAGATPQERDLWGLEDISDYILLASSGCYRLPAGPFSDDSIAYGDLRAALRVLGFRPKNISSMFSLLVAILVLGNLEFFEADAKDVSAYIANMPVLEHAARLLGVPVEDLTQALTNKTSYVRKELYTVLLSAEQSSEQRNKFVRDLYVILFAYVVESINHRLAPPPEEPTPQNQITIFDQAGFQTRGPTGAASIAFSGGAPLISAYGHNGFEEFCINFSDELLQSYVVRNIFEDSVGWNSELIGDGLVLPAIATMDNAACVELLRGEQLNERAHRKPNGVIGVMNKAASSFKSGKGGENKDEDMLQDLISKFGTHVSFAASPSVSGPNDRNLFGINHYSGPCSYDVTGFVEKDASLIDPAFVTLLRHSADPFISKLMSGVGMALERHPKDETIVVQAQVFSRPIRQPTPITSPNGVTPSDPHAELDPSKTYAVTTQINYTLSQIFATMDHTHHWFVSCIRPNDSGSPNSFDKRRVKAQIRSLLLPDIVARRQKEFTVDFDQTELCERYLPTMRGAEADRIRQWAQANGWTEGSDYVLGHRSIWLTYAAWKLAEDVLREAEREVRKALKGDDTESVMPDDMTEYSHPDSGHQPLPITYYGDGEDRGLLSRSAGHQNSPFLDQGEASPNNVRSPFADNPASSHGGWESDYDKEAPPPTPDPSGNVDGGMIVKEATNAVEEVPTSRTRRVWLWAVMACTFWIPGFCLRKVGRMKRPDIRLAWREKFTIFWLILLLNAIIIFYIVFFGRLLCPNYDKAWNLQQVSLHTGETDRYVAIQGSVYDVTDFINGDHSDISGQPSNGQTTLDVLPGKDLTHYFPVPLILGCPGLVSNPVLELTYKNFTLDIQNAVHKSGSLAASPTSKLARNDWYTAVFQQKIVQYYKGPVVWSNKELSKQAADQNIAKIWGVWDKKVYDLTDYFNTINVRQGVSEFQFLDRDIATVFQERSGKDVTDALEKVFAKKDSATVQQNTYCIKNIFYAGTTDFRNTPRCQVQSYLMLVASGVIAATMLLKCMFPSFLRPQV